MTAVDVLSLLLYVVVVVLLLVAALPVRTGRVSLTLLAAAILVFTYFVLPELA